MTRPTDSTDEQLTSVLQRARTLGFLGPGPLRVHLDHAGRFSQALVALSDEVDGRILDLGSGNGLPGLPLLLWHPRLRASLLDAGQRRCAFLREMIDELGLVDRADVLEGRAEHLAHQLNLRGAFDVVVSRGFGPPASTVECAVAFLRPGGAIIISEPPVRRHWPTIDLDGAALTPDTSVDSVVILRLEGTVPTLLPRVINKQRRHPVFTLD